jgi:hypothetical protein
VYATLTARAAVDVSLLFEERSCAEQIRRCTAAADVAGRRSQTQEAEEQAKSEQAEPTEASAHGNTS